MTRFIESDTGKFEGPPEHAALMPFFRNSSEERLKILAETATEEITTDLLTYVKDSGKKSRSKKPELADIEMERQVPDHDVSHLRRVEENGNNIVAKDFANERRTRRIVYAILKVHDLITHPKNTKLYKVEAEESAGYAINLLRICEYPEDEIKEIVMGVKQISYIRNMPPETPEAKIAFDADKMDQFGAIGFLRYFATGGQINRPFFHPTDPLHDKKRRKLRQFEYTLDARMKRMPEILEMMFTRTGTQIAGRRDEFELNVIFPEIEEELEEYKVYAGRGWTTESGAMLIMRVQHQAGQNKKSFYNLEDPFGESGRALDASKYPLDEIILASRNGIAKTAPPEIGERRQRFLKDFLEELKLELAGK